MSLFVPHSVTIVISQTVSGVTFFGLNLNNIALYKEFHIRKKTDHLFFLCIPASFGCYSLLKISLGNLYQKIRYLSNLFVADTPMKENENRSTPSQNNFKYEIANHTQVRGLLRLNFISLRQSRMLRRGSQPFLRIFTLIQNITFFGFSYIYDITH